jgi:glycosyltransferase involved in cell wall biosynthesis
MSGGDGAAAAGTRIGYLVPEFPGQTHVLFWREIVALRDLGVTVDLVSTRTPPAAERCHRWSAEAMAQTTYLFPPRPAAVVAALMMLLRAGPRRVQACLRAIATEGGLTFRARARMALLAMMGAEVGALAARRRWAHLHVHSCADSAVIAVFASMLGGLAYSLTLHGPIRDYGPAQRLKWGAARFGVTVTRTLRDEVLREVPGVDPDAIDVAAMGVDVSLFRRHRSYRPPRREGPLCLISCGRLQLSKGHQDLVRALHLLRDRRLDATLTIIGAGRARGVLEALVRELRLGDRVELTGALPEEAVRDRLELAQVFVLASHEEAIGVATMEAMAMELPVVVTRVGGVAELVRDGIDGFFVPAGDPGAIADAIERLCADPERARQMGRTGSRHVRAGFDSQRSAVALARRLGAAPLRAAVSARLSSP